MSKETLLGIGAVLGLIALGGFAGGASALYIMPQHVTQVIQPKQYQIVKTIETKIETKEVPPKSCLDGQDGVVVSGHSEHIDTSKDDDHQTYDYGNVITFDVNGVKRICYFEGTYDLSKNFTIGQKYHPYGGTPL